MALPSGNYSTSTGTPLTPGAPSDFDQGGLCNPSSGPVNGCQIVSPPGPDLVGGYILVTASAGTPNYQLNIRITDITSITGSYYEVVFNGNYLGSTPIVAVGGPTSSAGTLTVVLTDGVAPGTYQLGITNGYFANTADPFFTNSAFSLSVTQTELGSSPSPVPVIPQSLGRWRGQVGINWQGRALVGDAFTNVLGVSDFEVFTEYGNIMQFLVTTPPLHDDRKRIFVNRFEIEVEAGEGLADGAAPQMMLDYSKDGGKTWVPLQMFRSMGKVGEYIKRLRWINMGNSRTWVFRLRYTDSARPAIIGSYWSGYKGLG